MQGRPSKPLSIHEIEGTYREDRHGKPKAAVTTADGVPRKPDHLDEIGGELWEFVCRERKPWLALSDGPALTSLCEAWSLRREALDILRGNPTDKDARIAFTSYHAIAEKLLAKFGMTPTDRARMGEITEDEDDILAEFLA